ncbi:MAG: hypothetical protein JNK72_24600 [Myxococcales bacterium]|nr:hypothetical protein [Myxococcales bacterium]
MVGVGLFTTSLRAVPDPAWKRLEVGYPRVANTVRFLRAVGPDFYKMAKALFFVFTGRAWPAVLDELAAKAASYIETLPLFQAPEGAVAVVPVAGVVPVVPVVAVMPTEVPQGSTPYRTSPAPKAEPAVTVDAPEGADDDGDPPPGGGPSTGAVGGALVVLLALGLPVGMLVGCPRLPPEVGCGAGSQSCLGDQPAVCSGGRWFPVGDLPCGAIGGRCVEGSAAHCVAMDSALLADASDDAEGGAR